VAGFPPQRRGPRLVGAVVRLVVSVVVFFFAALALPGVQKWLAGLESSQKRPESSPGRKKRRRIKHEPTFIFAFVVMMVKAWAKIRNKFWQRNIIFYAPISGARFVDEVIR
jgi:Na+/H+ antiporter NhaD/arsenite permease-like protein